MGARRRENLQGVKATSRGLPEEEEESGRPFQVRRAHQGFEDSLYSWAEALRDSGESHPLTVENCQRWVVLVHILIY